MNVLEKILEEIDVLEDKEYDTPTNNGWIPCSERLPEINRKVFAMVEHSSWIADFNSEWVPEKDKTYHPETRGTYIGYINENGVWIFIDEEGQENICDKEFGRDLGKVYDVATYWQPLPDPYKPLETKPAKNTQQEMEDFWRDR